MQEDPVYNREFSAGIESLIRVANDSGPSIHSPTKWNSRACRAIIQNCGGNIFPATKNARPCQEILTRSAIAENHAPHTTTGLPPALAMTGRCDILAGYSHTAFNHDPEIADPVMKVINITRNITHARNAIISADANCAVRTMLPRKAPGLFSSHFCWRVSANRFRKSRTGNYLVSAAMDSNLISERAGRVSKWPKCKSRLIHDDSLDRFDSVKLPPWKRE